MGGKRDACVGRSRQFRKAHKLFFSLGSLPAGISAAESAPCCPAWAQEAEQELWECKMLKWTCGSAEWALLSVAVEA